MENIIVIAVVVLLVAAALIYIIKTKKKGRCIGCPDSATCDGGCASCSAARKKSSGK